VGLAVVGVAVVVVGAALVVVGLAVVVVGAAVVVVVGIGAASEVVTSGVVGVPSESI